MERSAIRDGISTLRRFPDFAEISSGAHSRDPLAPSELCRTASPPRERSLPRDTRAAQRGDDLGKEIRSYALMAFD